ncbi:MAG TPA: right-handed parallel beta-helix repeat-containing protein [Labilithrix sp.]|jgi:hypothetical protein
MLSRTVLALALTALIGCSSSSGSAEPQARVGQINGSDTWQGEVTLTGAVIVAKGATVEIAPGAHITCAAGASIYVDGVLHARAAASHAKISCPTWNGIAVDAGGAIDTEGVELENAQLAIALLDGAADSRFAQGAITNAVHPFTVGKGSTLTLDHVQSKTAATQGVNGDAPVVGKLVASYLEYDSGANDGVTARDGGALDISDSTFTGAQFDLVLSYGGSSVKIAYSTFKGSHCGMHIQPADSFTIDHVTADDIYGITIYASGNGPNTVSSSNLTGSAAWLDFQGDNGPIAFTNVYVSGQQVMKGGPPPTITTVAAPIPDAKPR